MKLQAPVKGIFFDIGWTLLHPVTDWLVNKKFIECADMDMYDNIAKERKDEAFSKGLKYLDDMHLKFVMTEGEQLRQFEAFYSMLAKDLPELELTGEHIKAIAYSEVYDMDNYSLFDDTISTLDSLKEKYKLGVISDTWPSIERQLKANRINDYFETKTFSCYLGTWKPDKSMYIHALEQMKLPPEQTVFIDDGVENLEGAEKFGIQPVLITSKPNPESTDKYPCINKLSKLLEILPE